MNKDKCFTLKKVKSSIVVISMIVILLCAVAGTVAFMWVKTESKVNKFIPGTLSCQVVENFEQLEKKNVKVKNTGNISGYIRSEILVNWVDSQGTVIAMNPVKDVDYSISINSDDWTKVGDYYYFNGVVKPNETTKDLIILAKPKNDTGANKLEIDVIAQIVQNTPANAVRKAWKADYSGGQWTAVSNE